MKHTYYLRCTLCLVIFHIILVLCRGGNNLFLHLSFLVSFFPVSSVIVIIPALITFSLISIRLCVLYQALWIIFLISIKNVCKILRSHIVMAIRWERNSVAALRVFQLDGKIELCTGLRPPNSFGYFVNE